MDVYLNVGAGDANDSRFDWSSAINQPDGTHRRVFVFNAGFYNDTDATGTGPRFVVSASNNATRSSAFPKNPARDPYAITATGWYLPSVADLTGMSAGLAGVRTLAAGTAAPEVSTYYPVKEPREGRRHPPSPCLSIAGECDRGGEDGRCPQGSEVEGDLILHGPPSTSYSRPQQGWPFQFATDILVGASAGPGTIVNSAQAG